MLHCRGKSDLFNGVICSAFQQYFMYFQTIFFEHLVYKYLQNIFVFRFILIQFEFIVVYTNK